MEKAKPDGTFNLGPKVYHEIQIEFEVISPTGEVTHRGVYDLNDHVQRRAFAIRIHDVLNDGYEVRSRKSKEVSHGNSTQSAPNG